MKDNKNELIYISDNQLFFLFCENPIKYKYNNTESANKPLGEDIPKKEENRQKLKLFMIEEIPKNKLTGETEI
jgi:hypothetical protein